MNWLLQRPTVSSVLVVARNREQLQDNLGATGWQLDPTHKCLLQTASAVPVSYPYYPYWNGQFSERNPVPALRNHPADDFERPGGNTDWMGNPEPTTLSGHIRTALLTLPAMLGALACMRQLDQTASSAVLVAVLVMSAWRSRLDRTPRSRLTSIWVLPIIALCAAAAAHLLVQLPAAGLQRSSPACRCRRARGGLAARLAGRPAAAGRLHENTVSVIRNQAPVMCAILRL